jgi:hypothetical protein
VRNQHYCIAETRRAARADIHLTTATCAVLLLLLLLLRAGGAAVHRVDMLNQLLHISKRRTALRALLCTLRALLLLLLLLLLLPLKLAPVCGAVNRVCRVGILLLLLLLALRARLCSCSAVAPGAVCCC